MQVLNSTYLKTLMVLLCIMISYAGFGQTWNTLGNSGTNPATDFIGTTDTACLSIKTDSVTRIKIEGDGRVGINGPTKPRIQMRLKTTEKAGFVVEQSYSGNNGWGIRSGVANDNTKALAVFNFVKNAKKDLFEVYGDGKVITYGLMGVGTNNINAQLAVENNDTFRTLLELKKATHKVLNGTHNGVNLRIRAPYILRFDDSQNGAYIAGPNYNGNLRDFGAGGAKALEFGGWGGNTYYPWMVIETSPNSNDPLVGIGTTSPTERLEVDGNVKVSGTLYVDSLAIGDTMPEFRKLRVVEQLRVGANSIVLDELMGNSGLENHIYTEGSGNQDLYIQSYSNNTTSNTIINADKNTGNVGIGTLTPGEKLDVYGNVSLSNDNGNSYINANQQSNVFTISGNTNSSDGPFIEFYGQNHGNNAGELILGSINSGVNTGGVVFKDYNSISNDWETILRVTRKGGLFAEEVTVSLSAWKDHVFDEDYPLLSLDSVEAFIEANHHLPEVPSEKEVLEDGVNVGEMHAVLLQKVEELTLYMIELKKENKALSNRIVELENEGQ